MSRLIFVPMKIKDSRYAECLYFTSAALARKVERIAVQVWKAVDLPPSHGYLLMAVLDDPGIQPSSLASVLHLEPSTITRFIEKLEQKKLVIRTNEGKTTSIFPTRKAKDLLPEMQGCVNTFYKQYSDVIGADESHRIVRSIGKIADQLDR